MADYTSLYTGAQIDLSVASGSTTTGHISGSSTGTGSFAELKVVNHADINGNIDVDGVANLDNTDIDGTLVVDGTNISLDSTSTLNIDNSNTSNGITIGTATSAVPISIGHTTSDTTINDNLIVTGNVTASGDYSGSFTSTGSFAKLVVLDPIYATDLKIGEDIQTATDFETANEIHFDVNNSELLNMTGNKISGSSVSTGSFGHIVAPGQVTYTLGTDASSKTTGALTVAGGVGIAKKLYVGTNLDVDGTTNLDGLTVDTGGVTVTAGNVSGSFTSTGSFGHVLAGSDVTINTPGNKKLTITNGNVSASYHATSSLGVLGTHRSRVFPTHANGQTVHISASGGTILQSTDDAIITLPATRLGLKYTFVHAGAATEQFDLSPNASDKIMGSCADTNAMGTIVEAASNGAGADNKDLQLDANSGVGDRVTIVGDGSAGWYITECMGSFVFES